ncbi:hypothetical protein CG736_20580 [Kitasatospora sp. CB02891]|nr:hypothetical protein CG736_20580 [Kitasatospora sp. CB02891]
MSDAAAGLRRPSPEVTLAFVGACRGDEDDWRRRRHRLEASSRTPDAAPTTANSPPPHGSPPIHRPRPRPPRSTPYRPRRSPRSLSTSRSRPRRGRGGAGSHWPLDAHRFVRLYEHGAGEVREGSPAAGPAALDQAQALWRGPALADIACAVLHHEEPFAAANSGSTSANCASRRCSARGAPAPRSPSSES